MPVEDFQDELVQDVLVAASALGDLWQGQKENVSRKDCRARKDCKVHVLLMEG